MDSDDDELAELRAARAARQGGGAATLVRLRAGVRDARSAPLLALQARAVQ